MVKVIYTDADAGRAKGRTGGGGGERRIKMGNNKDTDMAGKKRDQAR